MNTAVFHTVNSGLYFWKDGTGLLIDGLHTGSKVGFSDMPPELVQELNAHAGLFAHLDGLVFTHFHEDHYDEERTTVALQAVPTPLLYLPETSQCTALVRSSGPGEKILRIGAAEIFAADTLHDGPAFHGDIHESLLLKIGEECFFIAGDAALQESQATPFLNFSQGKISAGFFNLYQLASPQGQAFIQKLSPQRIFLNHLPLESDDNYHYIKMARQVVRRWPSDLPLVESMEAMAWLDGAPASWAG